MDDMQNRPLTIAELQEMTGELAWVQVKGTTHGGWGAVEAAVSTPEEDVLYLRDGSKCRSYGRLFEAYRSRPDLEDDDPYTWQGGWTKCTKD